MLFNNIVFPYICDKLNSINMANARRGLYIRVGYSILRDGIPEDLASVTALTVIFRHICQPNSSVMYTGEKLTTYANTVSATITDTDQAKLASGDYKVEVYYRRANPNNESGYEPYVIDAPAFTLTDTSTEVDTTTCNGITIQTINLAGEVSFCSQELEDLILASQAAIQAANDAADAANAAADAAMDIVNSKIDLDGLNSNIRQLKFNTATPITPTQAGQMAWSDEEKTIVLNNGMHTHPIGRETFFVAKNQSGALIANGKAVYAIGSTGANATIGLATTANGDIAQRTIGIATMDIASNGFGDVTTFGEVNDINTSGLTEGALIYLGLDGNLTSVEPIAPTPKISLGLCIRSHLTQGRIAVYVRPIARLNKLTDVYAPNLLDGDVLRWNGTALRYEIYNLVNKADLVDGKVPASQLPAYVDDILEYANLAAFPLVGETSKLYVTLDTNLTYRWSGSTYTEVSKSLAIGITSTTAFRGDWGKIAYDHSQLINSNPHGTTAAQIANTPAGTIAATTVQSAINELDADRVQLETNLNKTDIKNAEQDASIKSIEQFLSQSNMNQTAQVSSSGREIVSLPKTASNGGMDIKLEGLTAQNLVANGDLRNGTTGWQQSAFKLTILNNTLIATSNQITTGVVFTDTQISTVGGEKVYVVASIKTVDSGVTSIDIATRGTTSGTSGTVVVKNIQSPVVGNTYLLNGIATLSASASGNLRLVIRPTTSSIGAVIHINKVMAVNLTTTFGAGNEPDLATCDAMFSTYFEGMKSFIPTGCVKIVGKNLFNKNKAISGKYINESNGTLRDSALYSASEYIRVKPNTTYVTTSGLRHAFYDLNKTFISGGNGLTTIISPPNSAYVRITAPAANEVYCFTQYPNSLVFTPYTESKLYLTAPDLRSNGNVKDEIRKGSNGYEFVKRISEIDGTALGTPIITPIEHAGILNSAESGTVFHEPVVADAGVYGTNISILNTNYPISSLGEIMVHTNVDTYLDASKAVIASDGLSFTHPDLRAGDLVLFTYFFNKEKVNGLITATYYDGRYVIADTANGKFYKWGVQSTNGIATFNLTEV